jgi:hypothetical protein
MLRRHYCMATEKTPPHKRIRRAEQGRDEWKIKAQLRREENEKLKRDLQLKEDLISKLTEENHKAKDQIILFQKELKEQNKLTEKLKKNSK